MANLLSIGKSGLLAAQVGLATTGHNIANANVAGYSRQVVLQQAGPAQNAGGGFIGSGTEVAQINRQYDNFLANQVRSAQSTTSSLTAYTTQIGQIDNVLADPAAGLSPALQDFFAGVQDLTANPASSASRQALVSSAEALATRFQGLSGRLAEVTDGVNAKITADVTEINSYAKQIAAINSSIAKLGSTDGNQPNDLLDRRDLLVTELNKFVKTTVVAGSNNSLTVSIGTGQPLVVGQQAFELAVASSPSDPSRLQVAYVSAGKSTIMPEASLTGGELGGLMEFRAGALDRIKSTLDNIAVNVASTFNAQHALGQDLKGNAGGKFFDVATGAADFRVAQGIVGDPSTIAAAAQIKGSAGASNIGSGKVGDVSIDATFVSLPPATPPATAQSIKITFAGGNLSFIPSQAVTVNGTVSPAGAPVAYQAGDKLSFSGITMSLNGAPSDGDTFMIEKNDGAVGDNRNAALLGKLQTSNILNGGTATIQGAYAELVSFVGNKTREVQVNGEASAVLLKQTETAQQDVSGVNLDEEAANLLRYQQAYQAAGKVMQIASSLFDVLLTLGR